MLGGGESADRVHAGWIGGIQVEKQEGVAQGKTMVGK